MRRWIARDPSEDAIGRAVAEGAFLVFQGFPGLVGLCGVLLLLFRSQVVLVAFFGLGCDLGFENLGCDLVIWDVIWSQSKRGSNGSVSRCPWDKLEAHWGGSKSKNELKEPRGPVQPGTLQARVVFVFGENWFLGKHPG